jgi:cyanophycinase
MRTTNRSLKVHSHKTLIIIGGREDKSGERQILRTVAEHVRHGVLLIATLATSLQDEMWKEYQRIFKELGVKRIEHLDIKRQVESENNHNNQLKDVSAIFFTGGDQLKITSKLDGTEMADCIRHLYQRGGVIIGTSAGASVMSDTMLVSGPEEESHRVDTALHMAPGLGLAKNMIIDQHFAQRGRIGRLLGAVAQNPRFLGVGIDEDTAIINGVRFRVIGSDAVYVIDGRTITYTNVSEDGRGKILSLHNARLHVLGHGDSFNLRSRLPDMDIEEEKYRRTAKAP